MVTYSFRAAVRAGNGIDAHDATLAYSEQAESEAETELIWEWRMCIHPKMQLDPANMATHLHGTVWIL